MIASASGQADGKQPIAQLPLETEASQAPSQPSSPPQRHVMIAEAAYYIAEARGFSPSQELDDWLAAEREVEQQLSNLDH